MKRLPRHPRPVAPALLVLAGAMFAIMGVLPAASSGGRSAPLEPQDELSARLPFTHAKHVPRVWTNPDERERQRDCRGCHSYTKAGTRDPQQVCRECHFNDDKNKYVFDLQAEDPAFLVGLDSLRQAGSLFQHHNHTSLECKSCHEPGKEDRNKVFPPILMPKQGGMQLCLECHVGDKPRQAKLKFMATLPSGAPIDDAYKAKALARVKSGLTSALNGSAEMGPNRPGEANVGPFRHADHILPEHWNATGGVAGAHTLADVRGAASTSAVARDANCGACHGPMLTGGASGATGGAGAFPGVSFDQSPDTCGACHQADAAGAALEFRIAASTQPSQTAGTFVHAFHLGFERPAGNPTASTAQGYADIEQQACAACHAPTAGADDFDLLHGLGGPEGFQGCQTCHSTSPWAPAVHGEWWTHRDHGDWQTCQACHQFDESDFLKNRPVATVTRPGATRFRIEHQAHPHITVAAGEALEASCAKCHRQPVSELPSRIQEARFRHSSHLAPDADAASCAQCHGAAVTASKSSAELGAAPTAAHSADFGANRLAYDPAACTQCHLGSMPIPVGRASATASVARVVPEFSHGDHVGRDLGDGTAASCTTCHGPETGEGAFPAMTTLPTALDCSMCHAHSGERADLALVQARTGRGVTAAEIGACTTCHSTGIPTPDQVFDIPVARVADLVGDKGQFHPPGADCATCHLPGAITVTATGSTSPRSDSRVFARRSFYKADPSAPRKSAIHRGDTRKIEDNVVCFSCHWTRTVADSASFGSGMTDPELPSNRNRNGDLMKDFPGGPAPDRGE